VKAVTLKTKQIHLIITWLHKLCYLLMPFVLHLIFNVTKDVQYVIYEEKWKDNFEKWKFWFYQTRYPHLNNFMSNLLKLYFYFFCYSPPSLPSKEFFSHDRTLGWPYLASINGNNVWATFGEIRSPYYSLKKKWTVLIIKSKNYGEGLAHTDNKCCHGRVQLLRMYPNELWMQILIYLVFPS
jgi:hypothetical protein